MKQNIILTALMCLFASSLCSAQTLKPIAGQEYTIDSTNGDETIATSNMFVPDKRNWFADVDQKSGATPEIKVQLYRQLQPATLKQMFESLGPSLESETLTQSQILEFVRRNEKVLGEKETENVYATLFLFKNNDAFFVASVSPSGYGIFITKFELESPNVGDVIPGNIVRLVIPIRTNL